MKKLLTIYTMLTLCIVLQAQDFESKLFSGQIQEQKSGKSIEYGAIKNINTGETVLTDEDGYFEISGTAGDSLRFHSLGFEDNNWIIPGIWYTMQQEILLNVNKRFYALDEVEVIRYYSYAHFKQAFKDLKLPEDEKQKVKEKINSWTFEDAIAWGKSDRKAAEGTFGLSFSTGRKDKVVQQREAVHKLEEIQEKSTRFNYFTSRDNLAYLTGYKGVCLDSFMVFLNTQYSINYKMPELELLTAIMMASDDFKILKGAQEWFNDSTCTQ
ncbi:carboxypeptidase-like regulatory domain-containing protein [Labilibacter sediminis]|nr:carboxypeptidase-like regulatory domain-containing protein [Labilibacter sediminis]